MKHNYKHNCKLRLKLFIVHSDDVVAEGLAQTNSLPNNEIADWSKLTLF